MKLLYTSFFFGTLAILLVVACHPEPGNDVEYSDIPDEFAGEWKEHPLFPCADADRRLNLGMFYDGCADKDERVLKLDATESGLYPYIVEDAPYPVTCSIRKLTEDDLESRIEGGTSHQIIHAGFTWWGVAVHLLEERTVDLTRYSHLYLSVRSDQPVFRDFYIKMASGFDSRDNDNTWPVEAQLRASTPDYDVSGHGGFDADGKWHHLKIPVADFGANSAVDLKNISRPLILVGSLYPGGAGDFGAALDIDGVFFM